jgi:hypothetical protein
MGMEREGKGDRLSCPEIVNYNKKLIYNNYGEALELIFQRLENPIYTRENAKKFDLSMIRILNEL